ncbi:MAG: hypothetical protein OZ921_00165 [Sorangiineae bacterium]|nr:hypothetical protein [Polyangiaceae bacterium]MEB2320898.1 hypothetical protein [Sorangiineae bacterium]
MNRFPLALLVALGAALTSTACGTDEPIATVSVVPTDGGADAEASVPPPDGGGEGGARVRTIETRPRFGALDPDNCLLDGDFEYSAPDAMQYPWFGLDYTSIVTGAKCRHGLRCARVPKTQYAYILGTFVWPDSSSVEVEFFAKPEGSGSCADEVGGLVLPLADYSGAPQPMRVSATSPERDADGWCHVLGEIDTPTDTGNTFWALLISPRQGATGAILVDDAVIRTPRLNGARRAAPMEPAMARLVERARADFAERPPAPPRGGLAPILDRTARRAARPR